MISSPEINKALRKTLSPVLRENGFSAVEARKAWGRHGDCIWVLEIRALGSYFSEVTGWPPMSVCVWTGVYYDFIPEEVPRVKTDAKGNLRPREYECHARSHLDVTLDQRRYQSTLPNRAERERNDVWWIAPTGENVVEVVENIANSFTTQGIAWFQSHTDLENTFSEIEREHDCFIKFYRAAYFARHLGYEEKFKEYLNRLEREKRRIGRV